MRLKSYDLVLAFIVLQFTVFGCLSVQIHNQEWKPQPEEHRPVREFQSEKQDVARTEGGKPVLCMTKMHFGRPGTQTNLADQSNFLSQLPKRLHHTYSHYEHNSQTIGYFGHQTLTVDRDNDSQAPQKSVVNRRHARQLTTVPYDKQRRLVYQRDIESAAASGGTSGVIRSHGFHAGDGLEARGQFGVGDATVRDIYHTTYNQQPQTTGYDQQHIYSQTPTGVDTLMNVIRRASAAGGGSSGQEMTGGPMSVVTPSQQQGISTDVLYGGYGQSPQEIGGSSSHSKIHYDNHKANADASAHGNYGGAQAQTQVRGGASRDGTFDAKARSGFEYGMVQSQVQGRDRKAMSSSQSQVSGVSQSQTQVQMDYNDKLSQALAQGGSSRGSFTSAVQGGKRKGQASSQAQGPGQTSSSAQMNLDGEQRDQSGDDSGTTTNETHEVSATAQGGYLSGQSQTQLQGTKSLSASAQSSFGDALPHTINGSTIPSAVMAPTPVTDNNTLPYAPTSGAVDGGYQWGVAPHTTDGLSQTPFSYPSQVEHQQTIAAMQPSALGTSAADRTRGIGSHLSALNGDTQQPEVTSQHRRYQLPPNFVFPSSLKSNKSRKWYARLMSETAPTHSDAIVPRSIGSHPKFGKTAYHQAAVANFLQGSAGYQGYPGIQKTTSIPSGVAQYPGRPLASGWQPSYGTGTLPTITGTVPQQSASHFYPRSPALTLSQPQTGYSPYSLHPTGSIYGDTRLTEAATLNGYGKVKPGFTLPPVGVRPSDGIGSISPQLSSFSSGTGSVGHHTPQAYPSGQTLYSSLPSFPSGVIAKTTDGIPLVPKYIDPNLYRVSNGIATSRATGPQIYSPAGAGLPHTIPQTSVSTGISPFPGGYTVKSKDRTEVPSATIYPSGPSSGSPQVTAALDPRTPFGGPQYPSTGVGQLPSHAPSSALVPTTSGLGSAFSSQLPLSTGYGLKPKDGKTAFLGGGIQQQPIPASSYPFGVQPSFFYSPGTTVQTAQGQTLPAGVASIHDPSLSTRISQTQQDLIKSLQGKQYPYLPGSVAIGQRPGTGQPPLTSSQPQVPAPLPTSALPSGPLPPVPPATGSSTLPATRPQPLWPGQGSKFKSGYDGTVLTSDPRYLQPGVVANGPAPQTYPISSGGKFYQTTGGFTPQISTSGLGLPQLPSTPTTTVPQAPLPQQPLPGFQKFDPRFHAPVSTGPLIRPTAAQLPPQAKSAFKSAYGGPQTAVDPRYFPSGGVTATGVVGQKTYLLESIAPTPTATQVASEVPSPTAPTIASTVGQDGPQALVPPTPTSTAGIATGRPPCRHYATNCAIIYKKNKPYKVCNLIPVDCPY